MILLRQTDVFAKKLVDKMPICALIYMDHEI